MVFHRWCNGKRLCCLNIKIRWLKLILSKQQFVAYKSKKENDCYLENIKQNQNVSRKKRQTKILYALIALTKLEVIISYITHWNCYKSQRNGSLCLSQICIFKNVKLMFPAISIIVNLWLVNCRNIYNIKLNVLFEFSFLDLYSYSYCQKWYIYIIKIECHSIIIYKNAIIIWIIIQKKKTLIFGREINVLERNYYVRDPAWEPI